MKVRDVLRLVQADGWWLVKHSTKPGLVTVSGHPSDEVAPKTLSSILTQAGLKESA